MSLHPPTAKTVTSADGTQIYADAAGDPNNPSLVFLHGFTFYGFIFDDLFARADLLADFYLVRYDLRGHGRSGKPLDAAAHTAAAYAADYAAVANAFGLEHPIVIGWSLGTRIVADVLAHPPPPARAPAAFIALSGSMSHEFNAISATPALRALMPALVADAPGAKDAFVDGMFAPPFASPAPALRLSEAEAAALPAGSIPPALRRACLESIALLPPEILTLSRARAQALPDEPVTTPVLLIYGTEDKVIDGAAVAAAATASGKYANLEVRALRAGHTVWLEDEEGFIAILREYVAKVLAV